MDVMSPYPWYRIAPLVQYDDYDTNGYLLDLKRGVLHELNDNETRILSAVLCCTSRDQVDQMLSPQRESAHSDNDISALLTRLQSQGLLVSTMLDAQINPPHKAQSSSLRQHQKSTVSPEYRSSVTAKQRLIGAGHMIAVLNELRQGEEGFYKAYQYIEKLKINYIQCDTEYSVSVDTAFHILQEEYWFYRLVTGLIERKVAHLLGQVPGEEGLCMVKTFALCAYLLTLGLPAQIVLARSKYGSRTGFKLHVWGEMYGKPLNEVPNIRDRYRVMVEFPL